MRTIKKGLSKKIKLGNRGFSLIELLAAVVILGILTTIAIVSVSRTIERAKKNHYITQEKNMVLSAQSFYAASKSRVPKRLGQQDKVYLKELYDAKVIDKVLDYNKNECNPDQSFVKVVKYTESKYSYAAYLKCDSASYQSDKSENGDFTGPTINYTNNKEDITFKNSKFKVIFSDESGILTYRYVITKIITDLTDPTNPTKKNIEIVNSGTKLGNSKKEISEEIDLTGNIPGEFNLLFEAVDIYGNDNKQSATKKIEDKEAPKCGYEENNGNIVKRVEYKVGDEYTDEYNVETGANPKEKPNLVWKNVDRRITIGCTDHNSGCSKSEFTQEFSKDTKYGYIVISDNQGNKRKCKVDVFIDKTPPIIEDFKYNNINYKGINNPKEATWTNKDYNITLTAYDPEYQFDSEKDKGSGVAGFKYRYPTSPREGETIWKEYKIKTKSINRIGNSDHVTFETPTPFEKPRYMDVNFQVCDKAGNCSDNNNGKVYKSDIRIDKTAPVIDSNDNQYNATWINKSYSIGITAKDYPPAGYENDIHSDVEKIKYRYKKVKTTNSAWTTYANSGTTAFQKTSGDNSAKEFNFTTTNFSAERNDFVEFQVCDHAGNCSTDVDSKPYISKIQIDKTKPICNNSGGTGTGNTHWVNTDVELFGHCSDPDPTNQDLASGCSKPTISKIITSFLQEGYSPGTIYDVAGNATDCPSEIIQIDKTPPEILTVSNPHEATWTNQSYKIKLTSKDNLSGIRYYSYRYPTSNRNGGSESNWTNYSNSSKTSFTTTDFSQERNMNVNFQVCDWAGNCSKEKSSNIKIDKTDPQIRTINNPYEAKWINQSYKINLIGEDPFASNYPAEQIASGISKYSYNYKNSENVWHDYANSNTANFTTTEFSKERNETVTFKICDIAGNCTDTKNSKIQIDKTSPRCSIAAVNVSAKKNGNNSATNWSSGGVDLTGSCIDDQGSSSNINSSCKSGSSIVNTSTTDDTPTTGTTITVGTVYDNAGNSVTCKKKVYIDKIAPTCTATATNSATSANSGANSASNWSNDSVSLKGTCTDDNSQCDTNASTATKTHNTNTAVNGDEITIGTIKDNAGNTTTCKKTVYVDKTAPTCSVSATNSTSSANSGNNSSSNWANKGVDLVGTCDDGLSQCKNGASSATKTHTEETPAAGTSVTVGTVYDNAGNKKECKKTVYVDKTAPTCTVKATNSSSSANSGANSSSNWSNDSVTVSGTCSDSLSKCDSNSSSVSNTRSTNTDKAGTEVNAGTIKDNAGNTASCKQKVYIDKTDPTVKISYPTTGGNAYKYTGSASDDLSGLSTKYRFIECSATSKSWSDADSAGSYVTANVHNTKSQSYKLQVKDKAGNIGESACKDNYVICGPANVVTVSDQAMIYKWYKSEIKDHCDNIGKKVTAPEIVKAHGDNIKGPYLEIPMDVKYCNCTFDTKVFNESGREAAYCKSSVGSTIKMHKDGMAAVVYTNNDDGKSACESRDSSFTRFVCARTINTSATGHHGVYFYKDSSCNGIYILGACIGDIQSYIIPFGKWTHNGTNKRVVHNTAEAACEMACKSKVSDIESIED